MTNASGKRGKHGEGREGGMGKVLYLLLTQPMYMPGTGTLRMDGLNGDGTPCRDPMTRRTDPHAAANNRRACRLCCCFLPRDTITSRLAGPKEELRSIPRCAAEPGQAYNEPDHHRAGNLPYT